MAPPPTPAASNSVRVARNFAWLSIDTSLDLVVGLASSIVVARALGPQVLGHYSYALTLVALTSTVATLGTPLATRRFMARYLAQGDFALALSVQRATMRFQAVVATLLAAVGLAWVVTTHQEIYLIPAIASLVPGLLRGVNTAALLATEDARWTVRASMISSILQLSGTMLAVFLGWGLVGLTSTLFVSRVFDFGLRWLFVQKRIRARHSGPIPGLPPDVRRQVVRFAVQATGLLAFEVIVWQRSEILFLEHFSSIENVAFFSISFGAAQAVVVFPRMAASATGMTLMAESGRNPGRVAALAAEAAQFMALVAIPLGALAAGLAGPLVGLAYGARYAPAAPVMTLLALFTPARALFFSAQQLLIALDRQSLLLKCSAAASLANVALALLLIPDHGAIGAAWTKALTQTVVMLAVWTLIATQIKVSPPIGPLARLAAWSVAVAFALQAMTRSLPGPAGVAAGLLVGVLLLGLGLRATRAIGPGVAGRLRSVAGSLPSAAGAAALFVLSLLHDHRSEAS